MATYTYPRTRIRRRTARFIRQQRIEDTVAIDTDIARVQSQLTWLGLDNADLADLEDEARRRSNCAMDKLTFWQKQLSQMGGTL